MHVVFFTDGREIYSFDNKREIAFGDGCCADAKKNYGNLQFLLEFWSK